MSVPADIRAVLHSRAAACGGKMSFRDFSEIALFAPAFGYYRQKRKRVGRAAGTDFYTASSLGEVFGRLVANAAQTLLGVAKEELRGYALVEIGAEPGQTHFDALHGRFAEIRAVRLGDALEIPEKAVVFANELFDAQPFHRLVSRAGTWEECGVEEDPREPGAWRETRLDALSSDALKAFAADVPAPAEDGWRLDVPLDAEPLLKKILAGNWRGAAIFPDYGKTVADCLDAYPEGTARAYFRHRQSNALTFAPGEQDLTCHVLWDRLKPIFPACGFSAGTVLRQEAFFMKFAREEIGRIVAGTSPKAARERAVLTELLHPAKMGHAFQVLFGTRPPR